MIQRKDPITGKYCVSQSLERPIPLIKIRSNDSFWAIF